MKLPIYIYGMPVLREVAQDVELNKEELDPLVKDMFETMAAANGVGLAGPQIGKAIRVVVIDLDVISDDLPEYKGFRRAFFNAHVVETDGEMETMDEGCLSLPGINEGVKRAKKVHVTYYDEDFQFHDEWVEGFLARVMQHEFDHLEGHMFIDHLSALRKQMIRSKLNAFLKGKVHNPHNRAHYALSKSLRRH